MTARLLIKSTRYRGSILQVGVRFNLVLLAISFGIAIALTQGSHFDIKLGILACFVFATLHVTYWISQLIQSSNACVEITKQRVLFAGRWIPLKNVASLKFVTLNEGECKGISHCRVELVTRDGFKSSCAIEYDQGECEKAISLLQSCNVPVKCGMESTADEAR